MTLFILSLIHISGPFVAENAVSEKWQQDLRAAGGEFGAATGRPRRVGPFDAVASRYGLRCQHADKIALTKLDVLSSMKEIPIITGYNDPNGSLVEFDPTDNLDSCTPVIYKVPGLSLIHIFTNKVNLEIITHHISNYYCCLVFKII